mmetsp:Transcript_23685/g.57382  ORF Transcript_23685/g.57382 Transcript_23685/m.57382 type:complete len:81 (+) Transcript_23685:3-245(+)
MEALKLTRHCPSSFCEMEGVETREDDEEEANEEEEPEDGLADDDPCLAPGPGFVFWSPEPSEPERQEGGGGDAERCRRGP